MGASPRFHHSWFRKKVAVAVSAIQPETSNFFCGTCWICSWIAGHIAVLKCIKYDKVDSPCLKMGMFALRKKFFQHGISDNDPIFMGRWWWTIEISGAQVVYDTFSDELRAGYAARIQARQAWLLAVIGSWSWSVLMVLTICKLKRKDRWSHLRNQKETDFVWMNIIF
jgi:hypothetical protein